MRTIKVICLVGEILSVAKWFLLLSSKPWSWRRWFACSCHEHFSKTGCGVRRMKGEHEPSSESSDVRLEECCSCSVAAAAHPLADAGPGFTWRSPRRPLRFLHLLLWCKEEATLLFKLPYSIFLFYVCAFFFWHKLKVWILTVTATWVFSSTYLLVYFH